MNESVIIIGEGPTEYFFLTSLRDEYRIFQNIEPAYPKHTSLSELKNKIDSSIASGYNKIYCLIDLDNKKEGKNANNYKKLKDKYHGKHIVRKKYGIDCHISFVETERCTEMFFIFYFRYTTKYYNTSDSVVDDLNKLCGYVKTTDFFRKCPLHPFLKSKGGSLSNAIANANKSMIEAFDRKHTFSEIGRMFMELGIIPENSFQAASCR